MRRAPAATPRTRPEERPKKLTRRSASPRGNVFRMMASVSRAGMSSRRADAAPDTLQHSVRNARTRRAIVNTIGALIAQCSRERFREKIASRTARTLKFAIFAFLGLFRARWDKGSRLRRLRAPIYFC